MKRTRLEDLSTRQVQQLEKTPLIVKNLLKSAMLGEATPVRAIKAKCIECFGYEDYRSGIKGCTAQNCPLWAYRPYQDGEGELDD